MATKIVSGLRPTHLIVEANSHQPETQASEDKRMSGRERSIGLPKLKSVQVVQHFRSARMSSFREIAASKLSLLGQEDEMKVTCKLQK